MLLSLRDNDAKNAILHASLDRILVNTAREAEGSRKLSNAALRNPVFSLWLLLLLGLLIRGSHRGLGLVFIGFLLVLDGSFVAALLLLLLTSLSDGAG